MRLLRVVCLVFCIVCFNMVFILIDGFLFLVFFNIFLGSVRSYFVKKVVLICFCNFLFESFVGICVKLILVFNILIILFV